MVANVPQRHRYTYREYLVLEAESSFKHEYLDGEIYAMAGGTPAHAALAAGVIAALVPQLAGGPCRVFSSDLAVTVLETGLSTYPDVTVVCGPLQLDPESPQRVTNPTVVVEVLSDATEAFDRGEKFDHYRRIPTLRAYVLVAQKTREIEVREQAADGSWTTRSWQSGVAELAAVGCALPVETIYAALPASG